MIDDDAADFLADVSGGDARAALNAVELGVLTTERDPADSLIHITLEVAQECIQKRVGATTIRMGDNHYDTISAFIKSMRGSDPDAAVYYLARMLYAGEDIKFIARRIMILCLGGCRKCRSTGTAWWQSAAAQAVERHRYAGGADHSVPGGDLCGNCAEESNSALQCNLMRR